MKSLKYYKNDWNVTQTRKVSKCCWKNGADRFAGWRLATSFQSVKNYLQIMVKQGKPITAKTCTYICVWIEIYLSIQKRNVCIVMLCIIQLYFIPFLTLWYGLCVSLDIIVGTQQISNANDDSFPISYFS